jgi:hypothetical protein
MRMALENKRCGRRWAIRVALWALLSAALSVAAGVPEYEGKPVSYWLWVLKNPSASSTHLEVMRAAFRQAHAAVLSVGPAALPYLAQELDDRESFIVQSYPNPRSTSSDGTSEPNRPTRRD